MVIRVADIVDTCYYWEDGVKLYDVIHPELLAGKDVTLSFDGVSGLTSEFVNASLVQLMDGNVSFDMIRNHLSIVDINEHDADIIVRRFEYEVENSRPSD